MGKSSKRRQKAVEEKHRMKCIADYQAECKKMIDSYQAKCQRMIDSYSARITGATEQWRRAVKGNGPIFGHWTDAKNELDRLNREIKANASLTRETKEHIIRYIINETYHVIRNHAAFCVSGVIDEADRPYNRRHSSLYPSSFLGRLPATHMSPK